MDHQANKAVIDGVLAEMASLPCWASRRGHGTFLTFDFGDQCTVKTRRGTTETGTYHLWVYLSRWTLRVGRNEAGWDSPFDEVDEVLRQFEGRPIVAIGEVPTVIRFGGPGAPEILVLPENEGEEGDALFHLYLPGHRILSCYPRGVMRLEDDRMP